MLTGRAHRAGVPVLVGTDTALGGFRYHDELALLVTAGLTPAEVLRAACAVKRGGDDSVAACPSRCFKRLPAPCAFVVSAPGAVRDTYDIADIVLATSLFLAGIATTLPVHAARRLPLRPESG